MSGRRLVAAAFVQVATVLALIMTGVLRLHAPGAHDAIAMLLAVPAGVALAMLLALRANSANLPHGTIAATAVLVMIVAIAEEILWRGVAFASVDRSAGTVAAFLFTTAGFAFVHFYAQGVDGVRTHAVTGAFFGAAFLASGTVFAAMAMHLAYNLAVVLGRRAPGRQIA
ncbi:MAG TPA: CPBP family intramembrane glutamic endopeptidase [Candidatus Elarobacter sp.]|jgi:membrane protease YdiL (CAAX protease family)